MGLFWTFWSDIFNFFNVRTSGKRGRDPLVGFSEKTEGNGTDLEA